MKEKVFTTKEYNSNDGMLTYIWGPPLWHVLHVISFNYPVKPTKLDKTNYLNYFMSLHDVLPCAYCRDNYENNLKILPITKTVLKNRENFSKWLFDFHELVNKHLGKKSKLTYDEIRDRYENFRSRCLNEIKPTKIEKGCTEPLYGVKSKCVLNIIPKDTKCKSLQIDKKSIIKKSSK
jgi:hypothetical protein